MNKISSLNLEESIRISNLFIPVSWDFLSFQIDYITRLKNVIELFSIARTPSPSYR